MGLTVLTGPAGLFMIGHAVLLARAGASRPLALGVNGTTLAVRDLSRST
jgi:hypothetical protein